MLDVQLSIDNLTRERTYLLTKFEVFDAKVGCLRSNILEIVLPSIEATIVRSVCIAADTRHRSA